MFYWLFLGLGALSLTAGFAYLLRDEIRRAKDSGGWRPAVDLLLMAGLVPVALFSVSPYLDGNLVGAGDSYHYALQVADFVTQLRHGVMPILAGQSEYAFNGNIHTLRTAPYFTHLAGFLDLLTGCKLSFVSLQNLTVICTAVLAAWSAYWVTLKVSGGQRIAACLLAAIYVTSPATIYPLALNDMFATYMVVPWLVICWFGLVGILRRGNDLRAQLVAAGGLALAWYAHPPIAAWLTLIWATVQVTRFITVGAAPGQWSRQFLVGLLLAGLICFAWVSFATLGLGTGALAKPGFAFTADDLRRALRQEFSPYLLSSAEAGIQLGWTLWAGWLGALVVFIRRRIWPALFLSTVLALLVLFLLPLPNFSAALWTLLPERLVGLTNWPAQRLCPLLCSGIIVLGAGALRELNGQSCRVYHALCVLLLAGCVWNALDLAAVHRRPGVAKLPAVVQARLFFPNNLRLTRYSYALFDRAPGYFSHGWMDPEFESRLLDHEMDLALDNPRAIIASVHPTPVIPVNPSAVLNLTGPAEHLLVFTFADQTVTGEISIRGDGLERSYLLPRSGGPLAFGAEPASAKTMPLRFGTKGSRQVVVNTSATGVSLQVFPFREDTLPIRVTDQTPYTATVHTTTAGFLETPRMYLDGYETTVNGLSAQVSASPNRLAMVPIPSGKSQVILTYPGPLILRAAWLLSLACFAGYPWMLFKACTESRPLSLGLDSSAEATGRQDVLVGLKRLWRRHPRLAIAGPAVALLGFGFAWIAHGIWQEKHAYGSLRLSLQFPRFPEEKAEPLLTLGKPGAADCIYVIYDDPGHVRFGLDHWLVGGPVSEPIPINYAIHRVEITIGGLYPPSRWFKRSGPPGSNDAGFASFTLKIDDRTVFFRPSPYYASPPAQVTIGENRVGASVCGRRFSGHILAAERFFPDTEEAPTPTGSTP